MTKTYTQQEEHFEIIMIGVGPAAEAAAMNVIKKGFSVMVVTDEPKSPAVALIGHRSRRRRCVTR